MRLAAVYIPENSLPHIFGEKHKGQTLNLGGEYFYELGEIKGKTIIINKVKNERFIKDFWGTSINQLSAIVGANGTGKSSILQIIKNGCEFVVEDTEGSKLIWTGDVGRFIYHSPYLTESKSEEEGSYVFNISKLSQMKKDSKFANLDFVGHWEYHNSERLIRIISFLQNDELARELEELKITTFKKVRIKFNNISRDDWNTSRNFLPFFDDFKKRIDNDRSKFEIELQKQYGINTVEELEDPNYKLAVDKNRLKLSILQSVIHKLHSILETTGNKYLEEGFIKDELKVSDDIYKKNDSSKGAFFWFISNAYFKLKSRKYTLPVKEIEHLVNILYEYVENADKIDNWTILEVDFQAAKEIINVYQQFLIAFKEVFTYDETIFMTFYPDKTLSTGEMSFYELLSSLYYAKYRIENELDESFRYGEITNTNNYVILLDESDLGFHPYWKKKYIKILTKILPDIFADKNINIIITTHDSLTLSDIPNYSVVYLRKTNDTARVLKFSDDDRPSSNFGANISDLLADSFFVEDGLIGEFAKKKIQDVIEYINEEDKRAEKEWIKSPEVARKLINQIGEPYLSEKLNDMFLSVFSDFKIEEIKRMEEEYNKLGEKINRFKNDTNSR